MRIKIKKEITLTLTVREAKKLKKNLEHIIDRSGAIIIIEGDPLCILHEVLTDTLQNKRA